MKMSNCLSFHNACKVGLLTLLLMLSTAAAASTIHLAARSGDLEQVQRLVLDGVNVNEKAVRDETPLMVAALAGQGEIVNYLLQRGADINARNNSGMTALHAAAHAGHADIVELLIAKGARVNDADNSFGVTALHLASEENHLDTVRVLLKHDADLEAVEVNGFDAISRAGFREYWDVVNLLLASGSSCQPEEIVGEWMHQECTTRADAN